MKLKGKHFDILVVLSQGNSWRGMSLSEIGNQLGTHRGLKVAIPLTKLWEAGYIEDRWQGQPWAGESQPPDEAPSNPKRAYRFYRITDKGRQALGGRRVRRPARRSAGWLRQPVIGH